MPSLLLYGGTFNPIHRGHLALCHSALEQLDVDKILLMPAAVPPHKEAPDLAPAGDRLALCRLAARELPKVEVSDFELQKGGSSYTVDTLTHLQEQNPGTALYLLMGTDMFCSFTTWHRWRDIAAMATLVVGPRGQSDIPAIREAGGDLAAQGVKWQLLDHDALVLSSTEIRLELARSGRSDGITAPQAIYIHCHNLYGTGTPAGQVDEQLQQYLREYLQPLLTPRRYSHSLAVEQQAVLLADRYGADRKKAAIAGLTHDVCKDMDKAAMLQTITRSGIMRGVDFDALPQLIHSFAAPLWLAENLGFDDAEILDAVRFHTAARGNMTLLDQVVYLADFTSADRSYPDVDVVRRLCEEGLEAALAYTLRHTVEKELPARSQEPCPDTLAAYRQYCREN